MNKYTTSLVAVLIVNAGAFAQSKNEGELKISPHVKLVEERTSADKQFNDAQLQLAGKMVLVTVRVDGKLFLQTEFTVQREAGWLKTVNVPAGECEVTFQGEGMRMNIKQGIKINAGGWTMLYADIVAGNGIDVSEDSRTGSPR